MKTLVLIESILITNIVITEHLFCFLNVFLFEAAFVAVYAPFCLSGRCDVGPNASERACQTLVF